MSTILVTGGAGSVGCALVAHLAAGGHRVRAFDLPSCDYRAVERTAGAEVWRGDITDMEAVRRAASGVDAVIHLAALLPPRSEWRREATMTINVGGTENVIAAVQSASPGAHLVLSSSVCVYGDTSAMPPPIGVAAPYHPMDHYGVSKMEAEKLVMASPLPYTILRISGVSVPAFLAPPEVWPFTAAQRIEFVCRSDVVAALAACVGNERAKGQVFNIAGGPTWRMRGGEYVARFNGVMGLPPEEGAFRDGPGTFDWYDTEASQAILDYQQTSFEGYIALMEAAIEEAMGEAG
jgi:nucleoside-diphosphate-sugar epimerase